MIAFRQRLVRKRDPFAVLVGLDLGEWPVLGGDGDCRAGLGLAGNHGIAVLVDAHDVQLRFRRRSFRLRNGSAGRRLRIGRGFDGRGLLGRRGRRLWLLEQIRVGSPPQGVEDQRKADNCYGKNTGHERYRFVTLAT